MLAIYSVKMVALSLTLDASVQVFFLPLKYLLELAYLPVKFNFMWLPCKEFMEITCSFVQLGPNPWCHTRVFSRQTPRGCTVTPTSEQKSLPRDEG